MSNLSSSLTIIALSILSSFFVLKFRKQQSIISNNKSSQRKVKQFVKYPFQIHFVTYGDSFFTKSLERIEKEALNTKWFDTVNIYRPENLSESFSQRFADLLKYKRGAGYMCWKADILLQQLNKSNQGDIIVYCDAGCTVNKNGEEIFINYVDMLSESSHSSLSIELGAPEYQWTTQNLFRYFGVETNNAIVNSNQILSGVMMFKCNQSTKELLERFVQVIEYDYLLITDHYNDHGQLSSFEENRHDQSIFSILRKLNGTVLVSNTVDNIQPHHPFQGTRIRDVPKHKYWL